MPKTEITVILRQYIMNFPLDCQESVKNQEADMRQPQYFEDEFIDIPVDPLI